MSFLIKSERAQFCNLEKPFKPMQPNRHELISTKIDQKFGKLDSVFKIVIIFAILVDLCKLEVIFAIMVFFSNMM